LKGGTLQTSSKLSGPRKIALLVLGACILLSSLIGLGALYAAAPITAKIIDSATGQPIEGVNVVATWNREGGLEGGAITGHAMVMEAVTDANGQFHFPGWGPRLGLPSGAIKGAAPELWFFKSGYRYQTVLNHAFMHRAPFYMRSDYDGAVIKLDRFTGSVEDYAKVTSSVLNISIDSLLANDECNWHSIPKFLRTLEQQNQILLAQHASEHLRSLEYLDVSYGRGCGDLKTFVEGHGK